MASAGLIFNKRPKVRISFKKNCSKIVIFSVIFMHEISSKGNNSVKYHKNLTQMMLTVHGIFHKHFLFLTTC